MGSALILSSRAIFDWSNNCGFCRQLGACRRGFACYAENTREGPGPPSSYPDPTHPERVLHVDHRHRIRPAADARHRAPERHCATRRRGGQPGGFAAELRRSLDSISTAQTKAYGQAEDFEMGKPGVALNDVMVDLQKANVAFQTGLQVRNRLVAAYQEVMNLPA